jgi:parallel beta-helix repeat protein
MKLKILAIFALMHSITISYGQKEVQKKIQTQLILAEDNQVIELPEGIYTFTGSLSLENKKHLTVRGKGMDKSILVFKNQTDGAEGLRVSNAEDIVLEGFTIQDSKGDAIKTMNVKGITFRNIKTEWTGKPKKENGSYGLYPVQCQQVLIDGCVAIGASDAGIYVGQSKDIIVKNSTAHHNVAGIEIENSLNAQVFDNEAFENTGGILVFDLPDLVQKKGGNVKIFKNNIHDNNFPNFAPKGNIVASVPDGTGIMILAANNVEITNNQIINNKSIGTAIISYYMTEIPINDKEYYPYPTNISVHDNNYERQAVRPTAKGRMGQMYRFKLKFGTDVPAIQYDGIVDDKLGAAKTNICVNNNKGGSFVNLDAANDFKKMSRDPKAFDCSLAPLTF